MSLCVNASKDLSFFFNSILFATKRPFNRFLSTIDGGRLRIIGKVTQKRDSKGGGCLPIIMAFISFYFSNLLFGYLIFPTRGSNVKKRKKTLRFLMD